MCHGFTRKTATQNHSDTTAVSLTRSLLQTVSNNGGFSRHDTLMTHRHSARVILTDNKKPLESGSIRRCFTAPSNYPLIAFLTVINPVARSILVKILNFECLFTLSKHVLTYFQSCSSPNLLTTAMTIISISALSLIA